MYAFPFGRRYPIDVQQPPQPQQEAPQFEETEEEAEQPQEAVEQAVEEAAEEQ